jgi:hypothetical protein
MKSAARRVTEIGLSGAKCGPSEQIVTRISSGIVAATSTGKQPSVEMTKQPSLAAWISEIKGIVSEDQLEPAVESTRTELIALAGSNPAEQIQALLYLAASVNIQLAHERNYNAIFGSQLSLLAQANSAGGAIPAMANGLYETAKANVPSLYATYTFEQWASFLIRSGLVEVGDNGNYLLTSYGRGFLKYIVDRQLSVNKPN